MVPIDELKPHPKNRNKHSKAQIERLAKILDYQGWRRPIRVSKLSGFITAGHGALLAAKKNKWKEVPVDFQDYENEDQEYADVQADNAIAAWAELDLDAIALDLEMMPDDFDQDLLGLEEILKVIEPEKEEIEDEIPEVKESICKPGDLWILGNHRLLCGDATNREDVERLMNGEKMVLMVTDPPYGVNYDAEWRKEALGDNFLGKVRTGKVSNDDKADWTEAWVLSGAQVAYVWHASAFADVVMNSLRNADYEIKQQIIWVKTVAAMGRQSYHWKHEPCWYAVKKGKDLHWIGDRKQVTTWEAASPLHIMSGSKEEKTAHPTQKPTSIYEKPILNHLKTGQSLYDPFLGSGTALIACEKTGRRCFGMEIDPHYCDVIIERWERYSGKKAQRQLE